MTRADKFEEIFGYRPATDQIPCNEHDWCGENDACNYCMCNPNNIGREEDWWNAEYEEQTGEKEMRALITIFDEDSGRVFVKDKLLTPTNVVEHPELIATRYNFNFEINIAKDPPIPTYSDEIIDKRTEDIK